MAGYSPAPLAQKLGIKAHSRLLLVGAPADFTIPDLPEGVVAKRRPSSGPYDTILLFAITQADLLRAFDCGRRAPHHGRRALGLLAQEGVRAAARPHRDRGARHRPGRRPRRQQGLRGRRDLVRTALRAPPRRPLTPRLTLGSAKRSAGAEPALDVGVEGRRAGGKVQPHLTGGVRGDDDAAGRVLLRPSSPAPARA